MTKLNQIIAVEKGVKSTAKNQFTAIYQELQKPSLINGISRTYAPRDEEGEPLPSESTLVQINVDSALKSAEEALTRLFDVTLTKEVANTLATADVKVGGATILTAVPVTYLLFLERELVDLRTFITSLPTLDPAVKWSLDANTGVYTSEPTVTSRTKKVPKNWVKYPATAEHPAQVEIFHEDVIVGDWTQVKTSGALPATRKAILLSRVINLIDAVSFAREQANGAEVQDSRAAKAVFAYLFGA